VAGCWGVYAFIVDILVFGKGCLRKSFGVRMEFGGCYIVLDADPQFGTLLVSRAAASFIFDVMHECDFNCIATYISLLYQVLLLYLIFLLIMDIQTPRKSKS
jgi:hypothetical protein